MDKASELVAAMKAELDEIDRGLVSRFKAQNYKGSSPNKEVEVVISGDTGRVADVRISTKDTGRALELLTLLAINNARDTYEAAWKKNNEEYTEARANLVQKYTQQALAGLTSPPVGGVKPILPKTTPSADPVDWNTAIFGGKSKKVDKKD